MTTIQAQIIGESVVVSRGDFDRLLELARRSEVIDLQVQASDDFTTRDAMHLADAGAAFGFWHDPGEDIYSAQDGEPVR